ncbi:MAG: ABC transporter ATP-binding protein [Azospirillaceae bacterium]|nr:ABC transporter ATP-binding protein [Azospirillaceae bacterium]
MTEPVLRIDGLTVGLPGGSDRALAVNDLSLEVFPGEILCIVGESGSGKSVLLSAIMRALPRGLGHLKGGITVDGVDLATLSERQLRRMRGNSMAMIFQEPMASLNPAIPVGRQIAEVMEIHAPTMPVAERRQRVIDLITDTNLPDPPAIARRFPHQLSGGQCQRIVIAMALAMNPKLLLADEPTTALDVTTQAQILKLVRRLCGIHGHGILFVTHDFGVVADIADRVAVMQEGRLVEIGPVDDILHRAIHPYTRRLVAAVPRFAAVARAPIDTAPSLRITGLSKFYGAVRALDGVTLEVAAGSTLAIVGESGSGKSTLAKAIIRLIEPSQGSITIGGHDFATITGSALARQRRLIQIVFQDPFGSLNPHRSVGALLVRAGVLGGLDHDAAVQQAHDLVARVGLKPEALARKPLAFSGGQRQRIGIARALAMRPSILIADESVSALDVSVQKQVLDLLAEIQRETRLTMLFITHDMRVAAQIADRILVMRRGRVVEYGVTLTVLARPSHPYTAELLAATPGQVWEQTRQPALEAGMLMGG